MNVIMIYDTDCVKSQMKKLFEEEEEGLFARCSVPWTLNMVAQTLEEHLKKPPCDVSNAVIQSLKLMEFFYKATAYLLPNCKGKTINLL